MESSTHNSPRFPSSSRAFTASAPASPASPSSRSSSAASSATSSTSSTLRLSTPRRSTPTLRALCRRKHDSPRRWLARSCFRSRSSGSPGPGTTAASLTGLRSSGLVSSAWRCSWPSWRCSTVSTSAKLAWTSANFCSLDIVDAYLARAATAFAINTVVRSAAAASFPLFTPQSKRVFVLLLSRN